MSRLTFARSAGAAGPKMTDVRYIYIYRQTDRGRVELQGGAHSRSPQLVHYGASVSEVADSTEARSQSLNPHYLLSTAILVECWSIMGRA